jgi:hypothetical protein
MQPSLRLGNASEPKADVGTLLTSASLRDTDAFCEALVSDRSTVSYDEAHRSLGLTRVSTWVQREPGAAVTMWEGPHMDTLLERVASSPNPFLARWRGQHRMWGGPEEVNQFWDASRHRLLSWMTDEQGAESVLMTYRDPGQVEMYRRLADELRQDPALWSIFGRIRQRQGFTRIETWHQESLAGATLLILTEAHDLGAGISQIMAEDNDLDRRTMEMMRSTLHQLPPPPTATLLARWDAEEAKAATP